MIRVLFLKTIFKSSACYLITHHFNFFYNSLFRNNFTIYTIHYKILKNILSYIIKIEKILKLLEYRILPMF